MIHTNCCGVFFLSQYIMRFLHMLYTFVLCAECTPSVHVNIFERENNINYSSAMITRRTGRGVEPAPGGNSPNFSVEATFLFFSCLIMEIIMKFYMCNPRDDQSGRLNPHAENILKQANKTMANGLGK